MQQGFAVRLATRRPLAAMREGVEGVIVPSVHGQTNWREALLGVDAVVHCVAHQSQGAVAEAVQGDSYSRVNREGTLALAAQAAQAGVRRFVFLSSVKVHGESSRPHCPFRETDPPSPFDAYGMSKLEAESGLLSLAASSALEVVVIRPPLVYGPGAKGNFAALLRWVRNGVPLPLGAATDNRRSMLAVGNLVDFIERCLVHPAASNQVFLASDCEDMSTTELLRRVGVAARRPARLLPIPVVLLRGAAKLIGREAVIGRLLDSLQVDSTKARAVLGWVPRLSVDEALADAMASRS